MGKKPLGVDVLSAARTRIADVFENFPRVYVSFSGGKDSSVLLHIVADEARIRQKRFGVLVVDLEAQYKMTVDHISQMLEEVSDVADPYWIALPLRLRNAVSQFEPHWVCWDQSARDIWVRDLPEKSISDPKYFSWFRVGMEFEELVPAFGEWYAQGRPCACLVGIRSDESLNRYRTIATKRKASFEGRQWTTLVDKSLYNCYPIYDWRTQDIWRYNGKFKKSYNRVYDLMHQAGLSIHQQRLCQPYGDDQRKGLYLYHVLEPETWGRVVARVQGANAGALYARESGNVTGARKITKPEGITWETYARQLLASMPQATADHYRNKIAVFVKWYEDRGYPNGIPDDGPIQKGPPSWARVCKALLRNDYWCKGLSFTQTKSDSYQKYKKYMAAKRAEWGIAI